MASRLLPRAAPIGLLAFVAAACLTAAPTGAQSGAADPPSTMSDAATDSAAERRASEHDPRVSTATKPEAEPVLVVSQPEQLEPWRAPLDFGALLFAQPNASTKALRSSPAYRSLIASLDEDERRAFPTSWFDHPRTHFELVGIVNRLDRRDMRPGTCGETRLLYRLEHRSENDTRRLPASFSVVFEQADDGNGCRDVARSWFVTGAAHGQLDAPGRPLHADRIGLGNLIAVEVNLRGDNLRTGVTSTHLSVHGYDRDEDRFSRAPFEFELTGLLWKGRGWTRLVDALTNDEMLASVRDGTPSLSMSRYGRPWDVTVQTPSPQGSFLLEALRRNRSAPSNLGPFASAEAASHRMETLTCSGCHRQRSVAGFHLPGEGGPSRLRGGMSAHLLSELPWRRAYVEAVAEGREPDRVRKHPHAGPPGFGESCSTQASPIADLSCQSDHRCVPVVGADFGTCLPESYEGAGPCDAADSACLEPSAWFPGGMTARACDDAHACVPVPMRADLEACARAEAPWACAEGRARRLGVDRCDDQADCRDGYVCVTVADAGEGGCVPALGVAELRTRGQLRVGR